MNPVSIMHLGTATLVLDVGDLRAVIDPVHRRRRN